MPGKRAEVSSAPRAKAAKKHKRVCTEDDACYELDEENGEKDSHGHPYGVKPLGNFMMESTEKKAPLRNSSLGDFRSLTDEALVQILSLVGARELCNLACVSKVLYVFAHHSDIWRELTLKCLGGNFSYTGNWKDTFGSHTAPKAYKGHRPLHVDGFYSDLLYGPWMRANLKIDPAWLKVESIDRRSNLSVEDFKSQYESRNRPVIITDVVPTWPAYTQWTKPNLLAAHGGRPFRVSATVDMTLDRFYTYLERSNEERPLYLFDKTFAETAMGGEYSTPPYFAEDLMALVDKELRPDYRWLLLGPARSGSSFHIDPNANFAWNALISGRKKWIMFPPDRVPPGVVVKSDGARQEEFSLIEWFMQYYDQIKEGDSGALECVTVGGELLYVPHGWWHCVLNVDDSLAIATNVVSRYNLLPALDFLSQAGAAQTAYDPSDGDVPTSVIYPTTLTQTLRPAAPPAPPARPGRRQLGTADLVASLTAGVERAHPGLIDSLRAERDRRARPAQSLWDRIAGGAGGAGGAAKADGSAAPAPAEAVAFSFGF